MNNPPDHINIVTPQWEAAYTLDNTAAPPTIKPISQRDAPWRHRTLGFSTYTIGGMGCALTCASMVARLIDDTLTPDKLQDLLKPAGGFWQANLNWAAIPQVVPGLTFDGITNWSNTSADVDFIKAHLIAHPLILWVDFQPGGSQDSHFVLGLRWLDNYDDVEIIDPWDGYTGRLLMHYSIVGAPNSTIARWVYGARPLYVQAAQVRAAAQFSALTAAPQFDDWPEKYKP